MRYVTRIMLAAAACVGVIPASAQTIADYSRSQRAVIEAEIAKNNAKVLGASASPPPALALPPLPPSTSSPSPLATTAMDLPAAGNVPPPMPRERESSRRTEPQWAVTGVFVSAARAVTEVVVEDCPYLLAVGEQVPGTRWKVASISANQVVMAVEAGRAGRSARSQRVIRLAGGEFQ